MKSSWQDPSIVRRYEQQRRRQRTTTSNNLQATSLDTSLLLSHFPWRIQDQKVHKNCVDQTALLLSSNNEVTALSTNPSVPVDQTCDHHDNKNIMFPSWSYVDIRRKQNLTFARQQLEQGAQFAKLHQQSQPRHDFFASDDVVSHSNYFDKAKQCYEDGLQMCSDYAPLWVALGALEANVGHYSKSEEHLQHALSLDATTPNAKEYLLAIQQQQIQQLQPRKVKKSAWIERSEMARQNVVLEQTMMMSPLHADPTLPHDANGQEALYDDKQRSASPDYKTQQQSNDADDDGEKIGRRPRRNSRHEDEPDYDSDRRGKRHRHRRRRRYEEARKHKKRKRRKSHDTDDDEDSSSEDDSQRRRRHRRRRRIEEKDDDTTDTDDDDSDASRQRKRDRRRRRKRRRKRDDKDRPSRRHHRTRRIDESDQDRRTRRIDEGDQDERKDESEQDNSHSDGESHHHDNQSLSNHVDAHEGKNMSSPSVSIPIIESGIQKDPT